MNSEHVHLMIYFETLNRFYLWFSKFLIFTLNFVIHKITTYTKYCYNLSTIFILKLKRKKSTFSFLLLWSKFSQTLNVSYLNRCSFYISYFTSHFWQHLRIPFCRITFTVTTILLHPRNILSLVTGKRKRKLPHSDKIHPPFMQKQWHNYLNYHQRTFLPTATFFPNWPIS